MRNMRNVNHILFLGVATRISVCINSNIRASSAWTFTYFGLISKPKLYLCLRVDLNGRDVRLTYFLSHATVFNFTIIVVFTLIIDKYTVYPNSHSI